MDRIVATAILDPETEATAAREGQAGEAAMVVALEMEGWPETAEISV
ncbi:MAG TPA: hypothetical protein VFQ92_11295 [Blastocatellia bacterium]|nr:hypothetical protein [Blastocatellia bacterium]